ncbi:MAG: biopolymer transporter ExbD [Verrucomicrobiota bacterium]|nr:biopolymer transporter ExbD [Verrucomicrobiota bacterium]
MDLIPHEEIRPAQHFNFAPMIDFLFLMLALFATLAISRATLFDTEVTLATHNEAKEPLVLHAENHPVHISIHDDGSYKWLTEFGEYAMPTVSMVQEELARQYQVGVLPKEKEKTQVLLHIDKQAPWDAVMQILLSVEELGFHAHPLYTQSN